VTNFIISKKLSCIIQIAKKSKMKINLFILLLIVFIGCKNYNADKETYEVISVVYNKLAKPVGLIDYYDYYRFLGKELTRKDSVHIDSIDRIVKEKRLKHRFISAIYPYFYTEYDLRNRSLNP